MTTYADWIALGRAAAPGLVKVDRAGARATITLNDPSRLNCLSPGLMVQLRAALEELDGDPAVAAVVLTGAGSAFSAGGDLDMIAGATAAIRDGAVESDTSDAWRWIRREFGGVARLVTRSEKLFVAALNGPAAGVGLAFALACDILLASERAVLVPAFGRLGLVPEVGTSWLLTRRLGYQGALAFWLDGRSVDAPEALGLGLVQEVVADREALLDHADAWCARAESVPRHALGMTKTLLRAAVDAPFAQSLVMEEYAEANCFSSSALGGAAVAVRTGAEV
jgi:2-(1,2-epoxy-1,2-dihydrophenyl)acetyl-CoA isomerase